MFIVIVESIPKVHDKYWNILRVVEWAFTIIFTIEYITRIWISKYPLKYITSFYGIIDLLSILPTYLSIFFVGSQALTVVRALRLLRVFRILKLLEFVGAAQRLMEAIKSSMQKLIVFTGFILTLVVILGSLMYLVEGGQHGFDSIPKSIYWAIVTITTVGFGDITPQTSLGQIIASAIMLLGYAIIAVPTGIVTVEMTKSNYEEDKPFICNGCGREGHQKDAYYCDGCGSKL